MCAVTLLCCEVMHGRTVSAMLMHLYPFFFPDPKACQLCSCSHCYFKLAVIVLTPKSHQNPMLSRV